MIVSHINISSPTVKHIWMTPCKMFLALEITRVIQIVSSVCEYCLCNTADMMLPMHAEIVDSVARHGHNLQMFEQCLHIVLCVYNV